MASAKRPRAGGRKRATEAPPQQTGDLRLIANLLALLAIRGETKQKQIVTLSAAGFSPADVAALLRITTHNVSVVLHRERQGQGDRE